MNKRLIGFFLALLMLIPLAVSCSKDKVDPVYIEGTDFVVKFGSDSITATQINSTPENDNVVVYTRDYMRDGKYSLTVGEEQEGRTAIVIRYIQKADGDEYDIAEITDDVQNAPIPVNGFTLTLPKSTLDGVRANKGQMVKVEGYSEIAGEYERHDLASLAPDYLISTATRRVNIADPAYGFVADKIYYVTDKYNGSTSIDVDNVVVTVELATNYSSNVISLEKKTEISAPEKGKAFFVFTGDYNVAYANTYFNSAERISFSMLDKANSYSDMPSIVTDNGVIEINKELLNVETFENDGVYVFDNDFSASVTPATDKKRVDVVIVDGIVSVVAKENARTLIPDGNGFVVTLVGDDAMKHLESFSVSKKLNTFFIDYTSLPDKFVEFSNEFVGVDFVNVSRNTAGIAVLYTSMFGATTNTNEYGTEIIIVDGTVTEIQHGKGNCAIPEDGYVLSVHKDNPSFVALKNIKVGDKAEVSFTGPDYAVTVLNYDGINQTRLQDTLIIYNNKASSGANEFGYEIAVDKDGIVVAHSHNGNIAIPDGGFALSGHGTKKTALEAVFAIGERVIIDSKSNTVTVIKTPEQKLSTASYEFDVVCDRIEAAKKSFANLNYNEINTQVEYINNLLTEAQADFDAFDFESALAKAESVISTCGNMHYATIESKGVQNRAVWYRSSEKSDDEVRTTVEKMKALNVNALYLETWYEGYCIGTKVEVDGVTQNGYNGDYDALDGFIRICHEYGIEVHAWVHDFFVGYYYEGGNKYYNPYFDSFKDKYLIDCKGRDYFYYSANNNYFIFLNANDRECRDYILSIYKELVIKYELDGLHLDYIRFPELNYGTDDFGYNQDIIDAFRAKTGYTGDPRKYADNTAAKNAWIQFRCDIITSFAGEVYDLVRDVNPDIWLSCATYPDIPLSQKTIAQDVKSFAASGYFDEIFSMSYGVNNESVVQGVKDYVSVTNDKVFYTSGIAAFLETTQQNFADQLTEVELAGADGVSVFALGSITPETYYYQMTLGAFRDPAVQTYYGSATVSAQMDYISGKLDNLSSVFTTLDADDITYIKGLCSDLKAYADEFKMDDNSYAKQIAWCNGAKLKIAVAKTAILAECGDNDEVESIISDFNDLEYWLTLTIKRLETRK